MEAFGSSGCSPGNGAAKQEMENSGLNHQEENQAEKYMLD